MSTDTSLFSKQASPVLAELDKLPFLHITKRQAGYEVRGTASCILGHEIERPGGSSDGIYAAWDWNGQTLTVRNDRYGFYPFFYSVTANSICISPVISRLIQEGADRTIDDSAMAVFLRLGYFLADDTPFAAIRCLPPNAELHWSAEGLVMRGGERAIRPQSSLTRAAGLEGYIDLFRQSMDRRPPIDGKCILPLSGGRDSRHIFLELCARGWKPERCLTLHRRLETDADTARQLADSEGVPLELALPTVPTAATEVRKNLETSFCSDEHTWLLTLADNLSATALCSYDGIAGDVLSASRNLTEERQSRFDREQYAELAKDLIRDSDYFVNSTLPSLIRERWSTEVALDRITAELKRCSVAPNPMSAFIFWNRTRREITLYSYGILRRTRHVFAPFLDHDLYDHLASLPGRMVLDRKFHDDVIRMAYPKAAAIPYASKTGASRYDSQTLIKLTTDTLPLIFSARQKSWIRPGYYASRLLGSHLRASTRRNISSLATKCLYLLQLENVVEDGLPK